MKKTSKRLQVSRETLAVLQASALHAARGADYIIKLAQPLNLAQQLPLYVQQPAPLVPPSDIAFRAPTSCAGTNTGLGGPAAGCVSGLVC
jgi:hypothetical protein